MSLDSTQTQKKILFQKPLINNFYHKVSFQTSTTALFKDIKIRKCQWQMNEWKRNNGVW